METEKNMQAMIEEMALKSGHFKMEAYLFVFAALEYTLRQLREHRHITGRELLHGISAYARSEYGPMTKTVFEHWGVTTTEDFGRIVFELVDSGLMGKTDEDSIDDFKDVYDFAEEFG